MTDKDKSTDEELSIEVSNGRAKVGDTVYHYYNAEFYSDDSAFYAKKINRIFAASDGESIYVEYVNVYENGESKACIDTAESLKHYTLGERELLEFKRDMTEEKISSLEYDIREAERTIKMNQHLLSEYEKSLKDINAKLDKF